MVEKYLKVRTQLLIVASQFIEFNIYLRQKNNYVLYATPENFSEDHKNRLVERGVEFLYIDNNELLTYEKFIEKSLPGVLADKSVPLKEKTKILYAHSTNVVETFFEQSSNGYAREENQGKIVDLVNNMYNFFEDNPNAVQSVRSLISTNYKEYIHCINTALYTLSLLMHHHAHNSEVAGPAPRKSFIKQVGVGALLHDIGKAKVASAILNKPGALSPGEFAEIKKHPIHGVEMCQFMQLDQTVTHCVLFHHEKLDGSGYPTGTCNIPLHVQAITVADMFDAITCDRPYRTHKVSTFDALKIITKDTEKGRLNRELVASFIAMISKQSLIL